MSIHENTGPFVLSSLTAAAGIATLTSAPFKNRFARGLQIAVKLANKVGLATVTPSLQFKMKDGTWVTLWTAAAALSANGTAVYQITPVAVSTASGITESKIAMLPLDLRVVLTFGGTTGAGNSYDSYCEVEPLV